MTNPQYTRLASKVSARAVSLKTDHSDLTQMITEFRQAASPLVVQSVALVKAAPIIVTPPAPPPGLPVDTVGIAVPTAEQLIAWIDDVLSFANDSVALANDIDWSGWLNWYITDINSLIVDLTALANWVHANSTLIDDFGTIVNDVTTIISYISPLLVLL